jgi:hypothetical protein
VVRGGLEGFAHGEQKGAGDGGDGGGGARGSGQSQSRNGNGMGREGSSAALEPEEMRREGVHGQCHGDGEVAAVELRVGVARAREGQGGGARAALGLGSTRGVARSWKWRRGATEAQHMAGETVLTPVAGVQRRSRGVAKGGRREEEVRGTWLEIAKTSGTSL